MALSDFRIRALSSSKVPIGMTASHLVEMARRNFSARQTCEERKSSMVRQNRDKYPAPGIPLAGSRIAASDHPIAARNS